MNRPEIQLNAVLFDLDDTLFDRDGAQSEIIRLLTMEFPVLFEGFGHDRLLEVFLETDRIATREFHEGAEIEVVRERRFVNFFRILGLDEDKRDEVSRTYMETYPDLVIPVDGAKELLEAIHGRKKLGIVTNGSLEVQLRKLDSLGIRGFFDCFVVSEDVGVRKPDPGIFAEALRQMSVKPENSLYVGDLLEVDVLGAKMAGMLSCWFNRKGAKVQDRQVEPDFEISQLKKLLDILE